MLRPGELKRVSIWAAVLVATILLPYPVAAVFSGRDWHFMGHLHAVDEGNVYLAWSRQAADGAWRLKNMYTATPDEGLFFNAFFVAVGKAAAVLRVEPVVAYHIARPICGWACLVSVYLLAALLFPDALTRWAAFLLAALSSGVGWLVHLILTTTELDSLDFSEGLIQPEAITFLCVFVNPLFAASVALMCLVFFAFLMGVRECRYRWIVAAGLLHLVLGNVHTYDIFVVNGALGLYLVLLVASGVVPLRHAVCSYGIFIALSAASPIYQMYVVTADPLYAAKATTKTVSFRVSDHALTYGFLLVLALVGAGRVIRWPDSRTVFLLAWLVVGAVMPYAPAEHFPFQRKMWEGYHVVLSLLAAIACTRVLLPWVSRRSPPEPSPPCSRHGTGIVAAALVLTVPSNLLFVNLTMRDARDNNERLMENLMPPIYLHEDELRALHWLRDNTAREDVVVSLPLIGSHIPAVSGNRVYIGHWAETIGFERTVPLLRRLYAPDASPGWCERMLREAGARYVYYGHYAWLLGGGGEPAFARSGNLEPVFASGEVTIYRVTSARRDEGR